jgi:hypothetical protein
MVSQLPPVLYDSRERELTGFRTLLREGQQLRDYVGRILRDPRGHAPRATVRELKELQANVLRTYADHQLDFGEANRLIAHAFKKRCEAVADRYIAVYQSRDRPLSEVETALRQEAERLAEDHALLRERAFAAATVYSDKWLRGTGGDDE